MRGASHVKWCVSPDLCSRIGGQSAGAVLRPVVGGAYVGASEMAVTGGNILTKFSLMTGTMGFGVGYSTPMQPDALSGNAILFPFEIGQYFGAITGQTVELLLQD